jgi:hypothetical protein
MKRFEPDFSEWTDQNHVPFLQQIAAQSQNKSGSQTRSHGLNMLWHNVLKFFSHPTRGGSVKKRTMPPYLS